MKITVETSGLKIGVNNSITESIKTGSWGVRLCFSGNEHDSRYEVVVAPDEANQLVANIKESLRAIDVINKKLNSR